MPQRVRDERTGARTASRSHRHAVAARPVDEVRHDEEVAGEPHLDDRLRLELEPGLVLRALRVARRRIRIQPREPLLEAGRGLVAQVLVDRDAGRRRETRAGAFLPSGIVRLQRCAIATEFASASGRSAKRSRISACVLKYWSVVKRRGRRVSESTWPSAMQTRASCGRKSSRVRNCTGCVATTGSARSAASATVAATRSSSSACARALHLEVVPLRKPGGPFARGLGGARRVALQQRRADVAGRGRRTARSARRCLRRTIRGAVRRGRDTGCSGRRATASR